MSNELVRIAMLFGALTIASVAADAQTPAGPRHITASTDHAVGKSREGQDLKMSSRRNATFAYMKALKLSDIAPGTPLGTSAVRDPMARSRARMHLFAKDRRFPRGPPSLGPGARLDLTNAMVTAMVQAKNGHELTLNTRTARSRSSCRRTFPS